MTGTLTTIRDLQNARQVLANNGHTKGTFIMPGSAAVCLEGAVRLATMSRLRTWSLFPNQNIYQETQAVQTQDEVDRHAAAILALAQILPERCPGQHSVPEDAVGFLGLDSPSTRVWHFNDHVCDGAEDADLVLEQAIQKLQADL